MTRFMAATSAAHWCELVARRELRSECRTFRSTSPCAGRQATSVRRPASTPTRHRFFPIDPERFPSEKTHSIRKMYVSSRSLPETPVTRARAFRSACALLGLDPRCSRDESQFPGDADAPEPHG